MVRCPDEHYHTDSIRFDPVKYIFSSKFIWKGPSAFALKLIFWAEVRRGISLMVKTIIHAQSLDIIIVCHLGIDAVPSGATAPSWWNVGCSSVWGGDVQDRVELCLCSVRSCHLRSFITNLYLYFYEAYQRWCLIWNSQDFVTRNGAIQTQQRRVGFYCTHKGLFTYSVSRFWGFPDPYLWLNAKSNKYFQMLLTAPCWPIPSSSSPRSFVGTCNHSWKVDKRTLEFCSTLVYCP